MSFDRYYNGYGRRPFRPVERLKATRRLPTTPSVSKRLDRRHRILERGRVEEVTPQVGVRPGGVHLAGGVDDALAETTVVAVSPFVEDEAFSGPAAALMRGVGLDPSTAGVADAYPFVDAFVLDSDDGTDFDRPVVRTETLIDGPDDARRVVRAVADAFEVA